MEISQSEEQEFSLDIDLYTNKKNCIGTGAGVKSWQLPYSNKEKFWTIMV